MLKFLSSTAIYPLCSPEGDPAGGGGGAAPAVATPVPASDPANPSAAIGTPAPSTATGTPPVIPPSTPAGGGMPQAGIEYMPDATPEEVAYLQSKGWDKSGQPTRDILNSYRNLEKLFGADKAGNTIQVPGADADATAWDGVYNKLGRPDKVDGYSEGLFEGMDESANKSLLERGHALGLSEKQMAGMREWNNEVTQSIHKGWEEQAQVEFQQQSDALDKEWGAAKEANVQLAREASQKMGWSEDQVQAMQMALGYDGVMKLAHNLGKSISEGKFVAADGGRNSGVQGVMTPGQAKLELSKLNTDAEFMKAWTDKNHPKHGEAVARKTQLTKWGNPA